MRFILSAVALIVLFGFTLSGADAKAISKRHTQVEWAAIPYVIGAKVHEIVNEASSTAGGMLKDIYESRFIWNIRKTVNWLIDETTKLYQPPQM